MKRLTHSISTALHKYILMFKCCYDHSIFLGSSDNHEALRLLIQEDMNEYHQREKEDYIFYINEVQLMEDC